MAKVLLVEDELPIAAIVGQQLRKDGYVVEIANDGRAAQKLINQQTYDIAVLDLMLPYVDGVALLKLLRQQPQKTLAIALTARGSLEDIVTGLDEGFDDYLPKPFSYAELAARLRALLRRNSNGKPILQAAHLEVNPASMQVQRAHTEVKLTAKEYQVLEYLLRHQNSFVPTSELLEKVWDSNYDGLSNTVAVHIKNLKLKLEKQFPELPQLIFNERGKGYIIYGTTD
jgi:two-component system copper resistance phosphate regulon response regulator CusR